MKFRILFFVLLVDAVLPSKFTNGQIWNLRFDYLTVDNGLSNNRPKCVLRDSRGYLWIGTESGLNQFDGNDLNVFENIPSQSNSLSGNTINCILEDSNHNLWIGTSNGLNLYDRKTESFKRFFPDSISSDVNRNYISKILEDRKGSLWISTYQGLYRWAPEKQTFIGYKIPDLNLQSDPNKIYSFAADKDDNLWIVSDDNVWFFNTQSHQFLRFSDPSMTPFFALEKCIAIDQTGKIWIGTRGGGLFSFSPETNQFKRYATEGMGKGTNGKEIMELLLEDNRYLLIAINHGGLNRLDLSTNKFEYCLYDERRSNGLNNDGILSLYRDNEGILYVGTTGGGLNICNPKKDRFEWYRHNMNDNNSLVYNVIWTFYEDSEGLIWIGTDGGGLSIFDPKKKTFKNYQHNPTNPNSISGNAILCITEDKNHDMWLGTWGAGLNKFDRKQEKFYRYLPNPNDPTAISEINIWDIITDDQGYLLLGKNGTVIDVFDVKKGVIRKNPDGNILTINRRNDNKLNGKTRISSEISDSIPLSFYEKDRLSQMVINDIFYDKKGNIWIGTAEEGLWILSADGKFDKLTKATGFPSNAICGIVSDNQENIWISHRAGLAQYVVKTKEFRYFSEADGLQGKQFSTYAHLKASDGTLYFGGFNGFNSFKPENIQINTYIPPVYINEFQIFNKNIDFKGHDSPLKQSITETNEIVLNHKQSVFSFGFTAINYTYPEKAMYAYKMEGYDQDWNYTDASRRYASYTNLNPGQYTFMVMASNNDNIWNENPAMIKITITPPFWRTKTFKFFVLMVFIMSLYILYYLRIKLIKNQKKELEKLVKMRTKEVNHQKEDIELKNRELELKNKAISEQANQLKESNERLSLQEAELIDQAEQLKEIDRLKNSFFTSISHEFRTPLSLIIAPLESILKDKEIDDQLQYKAKLMYRNSLLLLNLINEILELQKAEAGYIKLKVGYSDIVACVEEITSVFKEKAEQSGMEYNFNSAVNSFWGYIDCDKLTKILYNLISNAFKFSQENAVISVVLSFTHPTENDCFTQVEIVVRDSGIGILPENTELIFNRFFQVNDPSRVSQSGTGIGLALTKQLVQIHRGTIEVHSIHGEGTEFRVVLPVQKECFTADEIIDAGETITVDEYTKYLKDEILSNVKVSEKSTHKIPNQETPILLIIEDNPDMLSFIQSHLEDNYQIHTAKDGLEGYQKAISILPDMLISDIMLPTMEGTEICKKLKSDVRTSHIPMILLTAKTSEESELEGIETGADDYITKPFNMSVLEAKIKNLIGLRKTLVKRFSAQVLLMPSEIPVNNMEKKFLDKSIKIIEDLMESPDFDVSKLATEMGMSRMQLYRKFKSICDQPVNDFIKTIRIKRAAQLLVQGELNISEVAGKTGFQNVSYFSRCFEEEFGVLPSKYIASLSSD
jgi:signal transduction histidine kinase/ligand-binding sensor domain-containing protein/DNA-binding response OmpR family regulator